jgi:transposase InsO family protein
MTPKGRTSRVPLGSTPMIDVPFTRVAVDLVGPLPVSNSGFRYILTLVDYATRYPEAIALKKIETTDVAEALITIFSRVGLPREILHDQGTQFTAGLMQEIARLLSVRKLSTTPYHPIANGLVEKFNGTLKSMLKRMCEERPKDWDRYLPALLFAYREVPQDSLGFSPFEMLYGRTVRGPMMLLRELWTGTNVEEEVKSTYQYVLELRQRLEETCVSAHDSLSKAKIRQKHYYVN